MFGNLWSRDFSSIDRFDWPPKLDKPDQIRRPITYNLLSLEANQKRNVAPAVGGRLCADLNGHTLPLCDFVLNGSGGFRR